MKGKTILITGASSGIGKASALRFASERANLILTYNKKKMEGEDTERRCREAGSSETLLLKVDVMKDADIAAAFDAVKKSFGTVDVLINNAGTNVLRAFGDISREDIETQLRTNLEGLIMITRAFLPIVREGIINVGSFFSKNPSEDFAVYCASKYGVRGFTQALALEYPKLKICCFNPDMTATPLTGYQGRSPEKVAELLYRTVAGETGCADGRDVDVWLLDK